MSAAKKNKAIDDLFGNAARGGTEPIVPGAAILHGFAAPFAPSIWRDVNVVAETAPFRRMMTPGGHAMSVAMTNCGELGWLTDRSGYRYDPIDPLTGRRWPAMPAEFLTIAVEAAAAMGFAHFVPNSCLINRYEPGARMGLHQDKDERDFKQPIVSVSIGLPAIFVWGNETRAGPKKRFRLVDGDVVVWGGPARMAFHGVDALDEGDHAITGQCRINLTFRKYA